MLLGLFVGLAAATKFHFGLWLLPAVRSGGSARRHIGSHRLRLTSTAVVVATFLFVLMLLVPWTWTQPVLMLKEFAERRPGQGGRRRRSASVRVEWSRVLFGPWMGRAPRTAGGRAALTRRHGWLGLSVILVTSEVSGCWRPPRRVRSLRVGGRARRDADCRGRMATGLDARAGVSGALAIRGRRASRRGAGRSASPRPSTVAQVGRTTRHMRGCSPTCPTNRTW